MIKDILPFSPNYYSVFLLVVEFPETFAFIKDGSSLV